MTKTLRSGWLRLGERAILLSQDCRTKKIFSEAGSRMVSFVITANVCFDMDKKKIFRNFFLSIDGVGKQNSLKPRRERRKRKQRC